MAAARKITVQIVGDTTEFERALKRAGRRLRPPWHVRVWRRLTTAKPQP